MKTAAVFAVLLASSVARADEPRLTLDLELYTQARFVERDGKDLSELKLDRGEVGSRIALGPQAAAELRLEAIRSAADGGALGIDGDSTVVRVKVADVSGSLLLGDVRLDGALGFVRDPWIATLEHEYTARPLSRTGSERLLGWPTSDLSAVVAGHYGPVHASVAVGNGEGLRYPERNDGKTTTGVLSLVPVDRKQLQLTLSGVVRDGSIGVASIRDRRFGGGLAVRTPWARGALELVAAQGLADRGEAEGVLVGGWAEATIVDHVFAAARGASLRYSGDEGRVSTYGGGVAVEPWPGLRLWLAVDRTNTTGIAMPVPGADAGEATTFMLIASAIAPYTVY